MNTNDRINEAMQEYVDNYDVEELVDNALDHLDLQEMVSEQINWMIEEAVDEVIHDLVEEAIENKCNCTTFMDYLYDVIKTKVSEVL